MGVFVTDQGFQKRTLQQIKRSLQEGMRTIHGTGLDVSDEGPDGQTIGLFAQGLSDTWDALQEVYSSFDPAAATGAALDRICANSGVQRIAAAPTTVNSILYTDKDNLGTVVASGSEARRVRGALGFSLTGDVTIATASCQDIYLKFASDPAPAEVVTLTTSFGTFTATVDGTGSKLNALKDLADAINLTTWHTAVATGEVGTAQVWNLGVLADPVLDNVGGNQVTDELVLRLVHPSTAFSVTVGAWEVVLCGAQGKFTCVSTGPNTVGAGELSAIVTPQTGWVAVYNLLAGATGRDIETDDELRIRRTTEQGQGFATEAAILKSVNDNVSAVSAVSVTSNRGDVVDGAGRPPHSVAVNVAGGNDYEIALAIWRALPAGIYPTGTTEVAVPDSQGALQTVRFTRPNKLVIWVKVEYSVYSEEAFPASGNADIIATVVAWCAANLTTGKDVFGGRIAGAIYQAVPGIGNMSVTISTNGTTFNPSLAVASGDYAFVDSDHVTATAV